MKTRINKYLVISGLADSRRKADELIASGQVSVNDKIMTNLSFQVSKDDKVSVDGNRGNLKKDIYIAYNKPKGEICSHKKYGDDRNVFDSLPKSFSKLKIAGRLDKDSEGLIILSSDGNFINEISHPSKNKSKAYLVTLKDLISDDNIEKLNQGIKLEDGVSKMKVARVSGSIIKVVMNEGKNRQIRRTIEAIGGQVVKLVRIRIGKFSSHSLMSGKYEFIKPEEVI